MAKKVKPTKKTSVGGYDIMDLLLITGGKIGGEKALAPMVGNGTIKSGIVKLGLATVSTMVLPKGNPLRTMGQGVAIDGAEDLIQAVTRGAMPMQTEQVVRI
jgi:hypothetical protein